MKNLTLISIMLLALDYGYSQPTAYSKLGIYHSGNALLWDTINEIDSAVIDQNLNHLIYKNGTVYSNLPITDFDSISFYSPGGISLGLSDITATTLYCYSSASSIYPLTDFGVCWSTASFPTIPSINQYHGQINNNNHLSAGGQRYVFGLQPSTTYHFRAYAIIYGVTYYSHERIITTLPPCVLPTVITASISSITYNSAIAAGNVTNQGCSAVTRRGVCYGLSNPPKLENDQTVYQTPGTGAFTAQLGAMEPSSKYYVRAFAFNNGGIAYGNVDSLYTPAAPAPDGKIEFYCTGQNATGISVGINIYDSPSYSNQVASGCIIAWHPLGQQINCQNAPTDYIATLPAGTYYFKAYDMNGNVCDSGSIVIVANGCSGKNVAQGYQVPNGTPCTNCYCHH